MIYNNNAAIHMMDDLLTQTSTRCKDEMIDFILINLANKENAINFITSNQQTYKISITKKQNYNMKDHKSSHLLIKLERENTLLDNGIKQSPHFHKLTIREKEVCQLVVKGYTNKEITTELFISINTVKRHIQNIFKKMNVANRVELVGKYYDRY